MFWEKGVFKKVAFAKLWLKYVLDNSHQLKMCSVSVCLLTGVSSNFLTLDHAININTLLHIQISVLYVPCQQS
jgi:hypothetical protein